MVIFPNAKINLGLNIISKRSDGFHNLETLFYPIPWCDVLEVVPAKGELSTLTVTGIQVDTPPEKNLVMRALRTLQKDYKLPEVDIYLHKVIPFGAGLGGGSSDAAHMLILLNQQFELGLSKDQLASYAASLGSDCPFFIYNTPMYASGRGEIFTPAPNLLEGCTVLLIKPPFGISTPEAFAGIKPFQPEYSLSSNLELPLIEWEGLVTNDFENHLFIKYPSLESIKQRLYDLGAVFASMSGSGSTIYGIFEDDFEVRGLSSEYLYFKAKL